MMSKESKPFDIKILFFPAFITLNNSFGPHSIWMDSITHGPHMQNPLAWITLSYSLAFSPDLAVFKPCFLYIEILYLNCSTTSFLYLTVTMKSKKVKSYAFGLEIRPQTALISLRFVQNAAVNSDRRSRQAHQPGKPVAIRFNLLF